MNVQIFRATFDCALDFNDDDEPLDGAIILGSP